MVSQSYHSGVLHPEDLERLRRMSPEDRLRIGLDLTDLAWRFLMLLPREEAQRRLELAREAWDPPEVMPQES